jgi:hypothetical protein
MAAVDEATTNVLEQGGGAGTLIARADQAGIRVSIIDTAGLDRRRPWPPSALATARADRRRLRTRDGVFSCAGVPPVAG